MSIAVPTEFLCPITQEVMQDPVVAADGTTYERSAITAWVLAHGTSPLTRAPLSVDRLLPNRSLRSMIEAARARGELNSGSEARRPMTATAPPSEEEAEAEEARAGEPAGPIVATDPRSGFSVQCLSAGDDILISVIPPQPISVAHDGQQPHDDGADDSTKKPSPLPPTAPPRGGRHPVDVCCVIDVSGSMGDAAVLKEADGSSETTGLNLLDIVKHATRTIGSLLTEKDRLGVVTFTDNAAVMLQLHAMGKDGCALLDESCNKMRPLSMTNLWDGLETGMEMLRTRPNAADRNATLLLLTDGVPNVEPPRGHIGSLKRYMEKHWGDVPPPFTISTFGFGYNLNSELLNDIARHVGGSFVFIPDSGLVGTVFVNTVANVLCTAADSLKVSAKTTRRGTTLRGVDSLLETFDNGSRAETNLNAGTVHTGQERNLTLRIQGRAEHCSVKVSLRNNNGERVEMTVTPRPAATPEEKAKVRAHVARREFLKRVRKALNVSVSSTTPAVVDVSPLDSERLANADAAAQRLVAALEADLRGEVVLATATKAAFDRWGRHYLLSLIRANELQQCNNFKDHSVQQYGGSLFAALRDAGEDIFTKLPPPKPSPVVAGVPAAHSRPTSAAASSQKFAAAPPVSMKKYWNTSGGCIRGDCMVALSHGRQKAARDVVRGDVLADGAVVHLAVQIAVDARKGVDLVCLGSGLWITPFHPVRVDAAKSTGAWSFPTSLSTDRVHCTCDEVPFVYAFVLHGGVSYESHGVEVIALGHGVENDPVATHEYLGSAQIIADLESLEGALSTDGRVRVGGLTRNGSTMRVNGIRPVQQMMSTTQAPTPLTA